jgi:hypothetical protein
MIKKPFFREKDLYFSKEHNHIINSNFFILLVTSYASNFIYYYLFRISCFKIIIVFSSVILSICSFLYHEHSLNPKRTPLYFNEYNFGMLGQYYRDFHKVNELYVQGMFFTLNGICLYIHLLVIKISKTFYRCTFLMFHSYTILASAIIAEIFNVEIKNPFLCLGIKLIKNKGIFLVGGDGIKLVCGKKIYDIRIYNSDNYEYIDTIENAHDDNIFGFVELKDGRIASYSDSNDAKIKIWEFNI